MDGNRDESEKCIKLAQAFIQAGNIDQAIKFLKKSERLYPSQQAKGDSAFCVLIFFFHSLRALTIGSTDILPHVRFVSST